VQAEKVLNKFMENRAAAHAPAPGGGVLRKSVDNVVRSLRLAVGTS
jgi:hypothetical protein